MSRKTKEDVILAAGRLFAERGYYGTSMRDLGRELGLLGSSLYSHIDSKEDLLVEVVERGARLFSESAERAQRVDGTAADRLRALIAGHVDVILDHLDEARTFLYEARALEEPHRGRIIAARDAYERTFRAVVDDGKVEGSLRSEVDTKLVVIFLLSTLNAVERWYHPEGPLDRAGLVEAISNHAMCGLR